MPELAEVEFYRKQWDPGNGQQILRVALHGEKRIFRCTNARALKAKLPGARLLDSEASGKQMLFRFSGDLWLGIHLGMTGELRVGAPDFRPGKHDHLVLFQKKRALVFSDMRQFGLVRFEQGNNAPGWWTSLAAPITSARFTRKSMSQFLAAHRRLPIKASLLLQRGFPGVGNWMADEILWRAKINPRIPTGQLQSDQLECLWKAVRFVCGTAVRRIGSGLSDPPPNWLFHERWSAAGRCPRDKQPLNRETIGGRTAAWCPRCQSVTTP